MAANQGLCMRDTPAGWKRTTENLCERTDHRHFKRFLSEWLWFYVALLVWAAIIFVGVRGIS